MDYYVDKRIISIKRNTSVAQSSFSKMFLKPLLFCVLLAFGAAQKDPYFIGNRTTIVHLFEWKWPDIAKECETFLGPKGFAGVQV